MNIICFVFPAEKGQVICFVISASYLHISTGSALWPLNYREGNAIFVLNRICLYLISYILYLLISGSLLLTSQKEKEEKKNASALSCNIDFRRKKKQKTKQTKKETRAKTAAFHKHVWRGRDVPPIVPQIQTESLTEFTFINSGECQGCRIDSGVFIKLRTSYLEDLFAGRMSSSSHLF